MAFYKDSKTRSEYKEMLQAYGCEECCTRLGLVCKAISGRKEELSMVNQLASPPEPIEGQHEQHRYRRARKAKHNASLRMETAPPLEVRIRPSFTGPVSSRRNPSSITKTRLQSHQSRKDGSVPHSPSQVCKGISISIHRPRPTPPIPVL